ncbi:MAG: Bax inhibitor-1/YccA family protein [Betaproteobacteria bacterium]|nr:Bax inhibitor-1/YccA family protein [Betaproteobacteria bacterium]
MQPELRPVPTNDSRFDRSTQSWEDAQPAGEVSASDAQKVLRNTYLLLALTMVPTIVGAMIGISTASLVMQHPIIISLVMLGACIGLQFAIAANRDSGLGVALLLLMTGMLGWWLGPILAVTLALKNGPALVIYAAGGTGLVMAVMATIATTTKRDFSFMGKFLFVGMIVLLVAMLANMFLQIPALALTISSLVIVVFSLFLLHDLSRIVTGGETNYVMATTGVYMSLFNIFANLLSLLMALGGEKD